MRISFVEIANFRKLLSVRIDLAPTTTLLVGANNSGKTSAMIALRQFLLQRGSFCLNDFTLCHWQTISAIGQAWKDAQPEDDPSDEINKWLSVYPTLDLWFEVNEGEFHHVSGLIPVLDWAGGPLGVRLQYEPKDIADLRKDFMTASNEAAVLKNAVTAIDGLEQKPLKLWPESLLAFLERRMSKYFEIKAYLLDPSKLTTPDRGVASLQSLPPGFLPLNNDPLSQLIRINEITAQRGFGQAGDGSLLESPASKSDRRLSDQLRRYYSKHLDPQSKPTLEDLEALQAIDAAEQAFDKRLEASFLKAFTEVEGIGYPGLTDPRLKITTRLRPIDGLAHDAAVTYEIDIVDGDAASPMLRLPEDYNGLGYQNLISMIFALMSFRDGWMRVGKAQLGAPGNTQDVVIEPLHLVLVEEPEAHLHAQVQQVFIKKAYEILTDSTPLKGDSPFSTQMVVSSHSNHVAHETAYECLRYFRRLPAGMTSTIPVSAVLNMTTVFGDSDETKRFVTRYLKANHCDLFFADAVILLEGPAERMLVPHFIRLHFPYLAQCYISLLEIGGSHAHKLRPLLEHLGILTLVITDIDASAGGKARPTLRNGSQTTTNPTLKEWLPRLESIDELLAVSDGRKVIEQDALAAVRIAYQTPVRVSGGATGKQNEDGQFTSEDALPSTFEDSLVFTNVEFFKSLPGTGLVAKFRDALKGEGTLTTKGESLFDALRDGKKAEFALDVIDAEKFETLLVPAYISEGLVWLEARLKKKRAEILDRRGHSKVNEIDPNTVDASADEIIRACLDNKPRKSFFLYAGAGSGKTRSLVNALLNIRERQGDQLWIRGQRVAVITYTNKASEEIQRRLDYNALIEVSTIHSFAWALLQGHTSDIRVWLETSLRDAIAELEELQARGRAGSKAALEREVSILSKRRRLALLPSVRRFDYSPTGNKRGRDALNHFEVISCAAALLVSKPTLQKILISRFPVLLIDESQDTNSRLMDAFLELQKQQANGFALGLFGDTMQRIYADGKVGLDAAIPSVWAKPAKVMNHRSRERIVRLVNRIRAAVDSQVQQSRPDKAGGHARMFIFSQKESGKSEAEALVASRMAEITGDHDWKVKGARQTLILEHHMAANRLGFADLFGPLYEVENYRTGLLDGSLPGIRFLIEEVLPFVQSFRDGRSFEAMAILRRYSPLLSADSLKQAGNQQIAHVSAVKIYANELLSLWSDGKEPTIEAVLVTIAKCGLFALPDSLLPLIESVSIPVSEDERPDDEEGEDRATTAWSFACKVPFSQLEAYAQYIAGLSGFDTHQGVKGLEFKRVMVIIDDSQARGFMFSYDKLLGFPTNSSSERRNEGSGQDTSLDRTRRLLYVTCSRAEESLAVVAYTQTPEVVLQSVVREQLFDPSEVEIVPWL